MDRLRSIVAAMSAEEQTYLTQREQESAASIRYAKVSFAGASLLALVLVGLGCVYRRATRRRNARR